MSFTEPKFLVFLCAALLCYFLAPKRFRWCVLLVSSYVFYWFMGGIFALSVITLTIFAVFFSGLWAGRLREQNASRRMRRAPLALCLTFNFALLFLFRYSDSLLPGFGLLLIPGISFYTFQAAGYLVDIYRGKVKPELNPFRLALFVSFFPQLLQGPISRHSDIAADLFACHGWDAKRARSGALHIVWGYFLKLVIADIAAVPVNTVFADYSPYGGAVILFAVLLYSFQIYADFAGGISVAIGIAKIVGVSLPENFAQPFFARSITDFWRRWHITLGSWLKDYLFYPLALSKPLAKLGKVSRRILGSDKGKLIPACVATFVIYMVMGIWHGVTSSAIAFGLLNNLFITTALFNAAMIEKLRKTTHINGNGGGFGRVFATCRTFLLVIFLRYFARARTVTAALGMLRRTVGTPYPSQLTNGTLLTLGIGLQEYIILGFAIVLLLVRDVAAERGMPRGLTAQDTLTRSHPILQYVFLVIVLALIAYCGIYRDGYVASEFIYANY